MGGFRNGVGEVESASSHDDNSNAHSFAIADESPMRAVSSLMLVAIIFLSGKKLHYNSLIRIFRNKISVVSSCP